MARWLLLLALAVPSAALAQPASSRLAAAPADVLALPALDNRSLLDRTEAERRAADGAAPLRFAEPVEVAVDAPARSGWSEAPDGTRVWRLVVSSPGAYSLSFGFSRFRLPEGATLWIYPEGEDPDYRPFTSADNETHGELWTPIVPGDRAVIELNLPPAKPGLPPDFDLELGQVNHAFRTTLLTGEERAAANAAQSGSCNVDVVCPEGDGYRDVIRSVGAYSVGGVDFCSGAAVNNTAEDDRPLFLTANHCEVRSGNAPSVVVYWNYEHPTCRAPGSPASGGQGAGSRSQFNTGTVALGNGEAADWSVLEFDDPILPEARVFLAGWDRRDLAPATVVAIHHPSVEEKRISFEDDPTSITTYSTDSPDVNGTHIRVADWDLGTTEGGSSGSPLFNADKRIVGQLHGGSAACGNDAPDWYGRLYRSMNDGLAAILDPGGSGAATVDGREYAPAVYASAAAEAERVAPGEAVGLAFTIGNPTDDDLAGVTVQIPLPTGFSVGGPVAASIGAASVAGGAVSWSGTLPASTDLVLSFDALAAADAADGAYDFVATANGADGGTALAASVTVAVVSTRPAPDWVYDAAPNAALPDNGCPTFSTSTIDVPDAFVAARVSVGVAVEHTWRGDLRVHLSSPSGTTVPLIERLGSGGFGSDAQNLSILIDDAGPEGVFASGNHTIGTAGFEVEGAPEAGASADSGVGQLSAFRGEPVQGTWTLGVCDGAEQDTGALRRWSLLFVEANGTSAEGEEATLDLVIGWAGSNPVVGDARVVVEVARVQPVRLALVDVSGREMRVVFHGVVAGRTELAVPTGGLAAGTYFLRLTGEAGTRALPLTVFR